MRHLGGATALITGANSGIGYETALALHKNGANVILAGRDTAKLSEAWTKIARHSGSDRIRILELDLASIAAVRTAAGRLIRGETPLDLLINNAGVMMPPASKTREGFELQFGVNFLGHFVLTALLYPLLQASSGARIVTLSSGAYHSGRIDFENLRSERDYDPVREYAQSKLACLMFAIGLQ